jgi:hypothetical protein
MPAQEPVGEPSDDVDTMTIYVHPVLDDGVFARAPKGFSSTTVKLPPSSIR